MRRLSFTATALMCLLLWTGVANAQSGGFGIFFGDEPTDVFPQYGICFTDRQIRDAIAQRGYTDISLNVPNERNIQVRARRDGQLYLLDYNFCTDRIEGRQALR
jgi:hypothetical protein